MLQKILIISLFLVAAVYTQTVDKYEPNNDFSSAYPISLSDSIVPNATIYGTDTIVTDPSQSDIDYYRMTLDSGKIMRIHLFSDDNSPYFNQSAGMAFQLFDSSKVQVYSDIVIRCPYDGVIIPGYIVTKTGTYYLRIRKTGTNDGQTITYGLFISQRENKNIFTVLSPNGGETFSSEEQVTVKWEYDSTFFTERDIQMQYSIDNGISWGNAWYEYLLDSGTLKYTYKWRIPHLKHRTDQALIRVIPREIPNAAFGISKGTFTILASENDVYEPNDDFSTARTVTFGDSVVQNGIVMKGYTKSDSSVNDTTLTDVDFFKLYLEAGKHISIKDVSPIDVERIDRERDFYIKTHYPVLIRLYDASKNLIGMSSKSLTCGISHSGIYYCEVVPGKGDDYWNRYCLSIYQSDPITIVSPNGGECFQAGQRITIKCTADSLLQHFNLFFSVDNGISWKQPMTYTYQDDDSISWVIPALKTRTDQALIKVEALGAVNPLSGISNPFTILPGSADAYEPNNVRSSAYPIALGDSIVNNATIFNYEDSTVIDSNPKYTYNDIDYYKVNLTAEALIHIQNWNNYVYRETVQPKYIFDYAGDSSGIFPELLSKPDNFQRDKLENTFYYVNKTGIYNLEVNLNSFPAGYFMNYGFSIKSMNILASSSIELNPEFDSTINAYSGKYTDDLTKLTFNYTEKSTKAFNFRALILSPDDFSPLKNELLKVKVMAFFSNNGTISTDISIPYDPADLNGYPERSLAVAFQDFSSDNGVYAIWGSIDTINHRITVHFPYLKCSILQVYIKGDVAVNNLLKVAPVSGVKTRYVRSQKSLAVNLALPASENVELRLYNILGKCVQKSTLNARAGYSNHIWNLKGLPNGKYVLAVKAGNYRSQETLMVLY